MHPQGERALALLTPSRYFARQRRLQDWENGFLIAVPARHGTARADAARAGVTGLKDALALADYDRADRNRSRGKLACGL